MVQKVNGKWRMCVDFTNLNKGCPKYCYPLPNISTLMDATSRYQTLSFLDAFSDYHQIKMSKANRIHTSFQAAGKVFCYDVMLFGLKNTGATYQRMVDKIFEKQIGRNVDDRVIKYQLKLNTNKCTFEVHSGKFLGFMMTERGIEANPEKIIALMNMVEPRCVKDV